MALIFNIDDISHRLFCSRAKKLRVCLKENSLQYAPRTHPVLRMKLTIIRLEYFSAQDRLDLAKIWPAIHPVMLENTLNQQHQLYAAKFNDRLLAAVRVTSEGNTGEMHDFFVREVTRRRGVGKYLLEEVLAQNSAISNWRMRDRDVNDPEVAAAFLTSCGFEALSGGWEWRRN